MIQLLQLQPGPMPETSPDAWFLPGDSAQPWLDELTRCGLAGMETRLFLVPQSIERRALAGLLVVPARAASVPQRPAGIACRLVASRLFVPLEAILLPPVIDSEVRALCPLPVSFFHPAFGLSGFEEESALRPSDLLEAPEECAGHWNSALPEAPSMAGLSAVVLAEPPSLDDLFGGANDEIGNEPIKDLPPTLDEPKENAGAKALRDMQRVFLKGIAGALARVPHTGKVRSWVNAAEDWANQRLQGVNAQLEKLRNKELHRLLSLLDSDPEAGLRHAIPLSNFANRGLAPPGASLGTRSLNFDPRRIGGGPADIWNVPPDLQATLRRRYREMADREMQLGRHQRAAYIYAQLLGDLVSAANALKQGRYYREAAILYEERLQNPLEAARCLAEGGLLQEAIERFEKLGLWLEVADLQERAGNQAEAEKAIRRVVEARLEKHDFLGAAKLLDERLHAPGEALDVLIRAWPSSQQAGAAIETIFQILGRLGRHDTALDVLARFDREALPAQVVLPLLSALNGPARFYPQERVRHRAADFSRVIIARQLGLGNLSRDESKRLLDLLVRLAPQDRLLSRDANRYLADRQSTELRARRITPPALPGNKPQVHRRFELPRQIHWHVLRNDGLFYYALGSTQKHLTLLRGVWDGEYQSQSWSCTPEALKSGFIFEPTGQENSSVALRCLNGPPLEQKSFPAADLFFNRKCSAGTPSWLPTQGFPVAIGETGVWTVHLANHQAILSCHDKVTGTLQRTLDITLDLLEGAERTQNTHLTMAATRSSTAVAVGNRLVITDGEGGVTRLDLPGQAVRMFATPAHTRPGVAVILEHGAIMHWIGSGSYIQLDDTIASPLGTFVIGGPLVLISGSLILLLKIDSRGVHEVTRLDYPRERAVGVCATESSGEFAVLDAGGEMTVYRLPS